MSGRLTSLLGIELPIVQAPIGTASVGVVRDVRPAAEIVAELAAGLA